MIRLITKLFALVYFLLLSLTGLALLFFTWRLIPDELVTCFIDTFPEDVLFQSFGTVTAVLIISTAFLVYLKLSRDMRKKRVVAFKNPDGEVTISLAAIEDYVGKVAKGIPHIADVRSKVNADRKGVSIVSNVTITAGTNIPDVTEAIQGQVKKRLHEILGTEERINVKMHVRKIGEVADKDEGEDQRQVPYREFK